MNTAQLLNDIEQLPTEAQHQIEDFIVFIKTRYQLVKNIPRPETKGDKKLDFKSFLLNAPKIEEIDLERQRDYPKDIEF